jgi:Zn-finger nucleic acid-binding protein
MAIWQLEPGYRAIERWVQACERCGGAWVDRGTLGELVRNAETEAEARGTSESVPRRAIEDPVVYRRCPSCDAMMHRRNFGRISGVVVDECRACGTWFDPGELEAVLSFVRAGGLALTGEYERREAERETARKPTASVVDHRDAVASRSVDLEIDLLVSLGRWAGRWLRRLGR